MRPYAKYFSTPSSLHDASVPASADLPRDALPDCAELPAQISATRLDRPQYPCHHRRRAGAVGRSAHDLNASPLDIASVSEERRKFAAAKRHDHIILKRASSRQSPGSSRRATSSGGCRRDDFELEQSRSGRHGQPRRVGAERGRRGLAVPVLEGLPGAPVLERLLRFPSGEHEVALLTGRRSRQHELLKTGLLVDHPSVCGEPLLQLGPGSRRDPRWR